MTNLYPTTINPLTSSMVKVQFSVREADLLPEQIEGAEIEDQNETFIVYSNGILVKRTNPIDYLKNL